MASLLEGGVHGPGLEKASEFGIERGTLEAVIERSVEALLTTQNPDTGLSSAATPRHRNIEGHYDHWWLRDQMEGVRAINRGFVRDIYPVGTPIGNAIDEFTVKSLRGVFGMFQERPWQEGFEQKVVRVREKRGRQFVERTELQDDTRAPPVHCRTTGEVCEWPTQNQPDSFGTALSAFVHALKRGSYVPTDEEWKSARQVAEYIVKLEPHRITSFSLWEWGRTHSPTPLSTIGACANGLLEYKPYANGIRELIDRRINGALIEIKRLYPTNYTTPWHAGTSDLATLHVLNMGGILDSLPRSTFFVRSYSEMGLNDEMPGMPRYDGDYFPYEEAKDRLPVWFMGLPLAASVFLRKASEALAHGRMQSADVVASKGLLKLKKAVEIFNTYGFLPELFIYRDGNYQLPSDERVNDLAWNYAEMIHAAALGIKVQSELGIGA